MISSRTFVVSMALLIACYLFSPELLYSQTNTQVQEKIGGVPPTKNAPLSHHHTDEEEDEEYEDEQEESTPDTPQRRITAIHVEGNKLVPTEAILDRLPFKVGELFDTTKTRQLIHNLYYELKRFRNISLYSTNVGNDQVILYIVVEEKTPLKAVVFTGNKQIPDKELREKVPVASLPALDKEELKKYELALKKVYRDKGYHITDVTSKLDLDEDGKATAVFTIKEHKRAVVKQIRFKGNHHISGKKLRGVLFTREDWLLGFMDKSGTYQHDRIDADKHMIEQFYQNNGYINAKVTDAQISIAPKTHHVTMTYEINEGDQFTVSSVRVEGHENVLPPEYLVSILPIRAGTTYSRENLVESIKALEFVMGDRGYAYTHIEPSVQPDDDTKTVAITFYCDLGKPVKLRRLTILGNRKTRDKVIRRKISFEEGNFISQRQLDASKNRVEGLGFFDTRDGVNWKTTRISEDLADIDLMLKEIKTGSAHLQLSFGGNAQSIQSASTGAAVEAVIRDTNLFGSGIRFNFTGRLGNEEKTVLFNLTQPWMFDRPIYGALDIFHRRVGYDELMLTHSVNEKDTGGSGTLGLVTSSQHHMFNDTFVRCSIGLENLRYETKPMATIRGLITPQDTIDANNAYNVLLDQLFHTGSFVPFSIHLGKDARNHPMHPSNGYSWILKSVAAFPTMSKSLGFGKIDFDGHWFTPLIGDFDLVLHLRGYFGVVASMRKKLIPYRELFHIGGQASVRGFLFGQIGPQFTVNRTGSRLSDSIGGSKTFFVNVELIFPIMQDFSLKGLVFYDGGAGWDNPYVCCDNIPSRFITNNNFNYRHTVGVGLRLLNPMPVRIDWGFKLDQLKGESPSEVHFSMSYDW